MFVKMHSPRTTLLVVLLLLSLSVAIIPEPEVFEQYNIKIDLESTTKAHVTRYIVIKNLETKSLIPGLAHLQIFLGQKDKPIKIKNIKMSYEDGTPIPHSLTEGEGKSIIRYDVWTPIKAKGKMVIHAEYDLEGQLMKGVLFKQFSYPIVESAIPIYSSEIKITLPKRYSASFISDGKISEVEGKKQIYWQSNNPVGSSLLVEIVPLPFPTLSISGVYVFWGILIALMILFDMFMFIRRKGDQEELEELDEEEEVEYEEEIIEEVEEIEEEEVTEEVELENVEVTEESESTEEAPQQEETKKEEASSQ